MSQIKTIEEKIEVFKDWLYEVQWWPSSLSDHPNLEPNRLWVVMTEGDPFSNHLCHMLVDQQQLCITVTPGEKLKKLNQNSFEINPNSHEEFIQLLKEISPLSELAGVIDLWTYHEVESELTYPIIEETLKKTCSGFIHMINALQEVDLPPFFKLWMINSSLDLDGNQESLVQVPCNTLCKVVREEYPKLNCTQLSIDPKTKIEESSAIVCKELAVASNEPQIAWRQGVRLFARLVPVEIDTFQSPHILADVTYLIAGGLRPLGLEVARWYVNQGAKNLLLLDELVLTHEIESEINQLKALGVTIVHHITSFDNYTSIKYFLDHATKKFPPLRGLIHCAGIIEQDLLRHLHWDRFQEANRLKIAGSWHLHQLTKNLELDHFILFSTALIDLAPSSRASYAVGNAFLNSLSYYRKNLGLCSLAINWGPWLLRKMQVQHLTDTSLTTRTKLLNPQEALPLLENIFYSEKAVIIAALIEWETIFTQTKIQNPLLDEMSFRIRPRKEEKLKEILAVPIAIIGMACRFPGNGQNPDKFWDLLQSGRDGIVDIPKDRWDIENFYDANKDAPGKMYIRQAGFLQEPIDLFDADFFKISRREAEALDPQQRLLLEVCYEALEYAGISPETIAGTNAGVFIGIMYDDYLRNLDQGVVRDLISPYYASGNLFSVLSGRLSYFFNINGPCLSVDTACSSSLVAIDIACERLYLGETNLAIAGGVNLTLRPESVIMECKSKMLAEDGRCKTFDLSADGFGRGEGCGLVILKRLDDALRDGDNILAVIKGTAVNHGGTTVGLTVPSGNAQAKLIRLALSHANTLPEDISYIEAHGTGTALGDAIEFEGLSAVFKREDKDNPLIIGSVKTNIGHTESAAGIASVIKVILALQNRQIPAHLHLKNINPMFNVASIPALIPTKTIPWPEKDKPRIAGISSFGFSGINAHLILQEAPKQTLSNEIKGPYLIILSAKNESALKEGIQKLKEFLENHPEINMANVAYTLQMGRQAYPYRSAFVCNDRAEAIRLLSSEIVPVFCKANLPNKRKEIVKDLKEVAELWLKGTRINWNAYYVDKKPRRIPLPTYCFQRERYWAEAIDTASIQKVEKKETPEDLPQFIEGDSEDNQKKNLKDFVRKSLEKTLKTTPDDSKNFYEQGIDSIMLEELRNILVSGLHNRIALDISTIIDHATIDELVGALYDLLYPQKAVKHEVKKGEWIIEQKSLKPPKIRLFCFHHAGGGASAFSGWRQKLRDDMSLCLIQLPGREMRMTEPLITDLNTIIHEISQEMLPYSDIPFIFFGHSMGAFISFEVAKHLNKLNRPVPKLLLLSCFSPFETELSKTLFSQNTESMTDKEFINYINRSFGGISDAVLSNEELLKIFLPILRSDFSIFRTVRNTDEKVPIPIITIYCTEDRANSEKSIQEWSLFTTGRYEHIKLSGGHFEILANPEPFIKIITSNLQSL